MHFSQHPVLALRAFGAQPVRGRGGSGPGRSAGPARGRAARPGPAGVTMATRGRRGWRGGAPGVEPPGSQPAPANSRRLQRPRLHRAGGRPGRCRAAGPFRGLVARGAGQRGGPLIILRGGREEGVSRGVFVVVRRIFHYSSPPPPPAISFYFCGFSRSFERYRRRGDASHRREEPCGAAGVLPRRPPQQQRRPGRAGGADGERAAAARRPGEPRCPQPCRPPARRARLSSAAPGWQPPAGAVHAPAPRLPAKIWRGGVRR